MRVRIGWRVFHGCTCQNQRITSRRSYPDAAFSVITPSTFRQNTRNLGPWPFTFDNSGAPVFKMRNVAGEILPTLHDHIAVLGVEFHQPRRASHLVTCDERDPEPPNRSRTRSPALLLFASARSINSTGFMVGWRRFAAGFFSCHSVDCDLSPYHGSLCPCGGSRRSAHVGTYNDRNPRRRYSSPR
jgi:hypothetical protein